MLWLGNTDIGIMIDNKVFETILGRVSGKMKQAARSAYSGIASGDFKQLHFEEDVIREVFEGMLSEAGAFVKNGHAGKPEEVILSFIKLGVSKDNIKYRKNQFQIKLPNCCFRIYRESSGYYEASSCTVAVGRICKVTGLTPAELASFALEFDTLIPRIRKEAEKLACEWKKMLLTDTIRKRTAKILVSDFLKTIDLSDCDWEVYDDGTVHVSARIVEVREAHITVPVEELKKNLEILKEQLEKMPRKVEKETRTRLLADIVKESVNL